MCLKHDYDAFKHFVLNPFKTWDILTRGHALWEVAGSNPGRGTKVGGMFHPTSLLARFSPSNIPSIENSKFI